MRMIYRLTCLLTLSLMSGCSSTGGWHVSDQKSADTIYQHPLGLEIAVPKDLKVTAQGDILTVKKDGCACEYVATAYPSKEAAQKAGEVFVDESEAKVKEKAADSYNAEEFSTAKKDLDSGSTAYLADWIPGNSEIGLLAVGDAKRGCFYYCHNHSAKEAGHLSPGSLTVALK